MPLTDSIARNAKPAAKAVRMFDRDGLYLEVSPRGGKWWRLKYRFAGKEKRVSLGVYPEVNLKKARARTIDARQLLDAGVDPSEKRRAAKAAQMEGAANSFEVVTREWIGQQMKSWVKGHGERILTRFERDIFPWIGTRPIADLTAPELLTAVRRIEKRGALETAHRALGNCGQVFRYAPARACGARSEWTRLQPHGASGGAPENDAGLGGLPGQAQERRRDLGLRPAGYSDWFQCGSPTGRAPHSAAIRSACPA